MPGLSQMSVANPQELHKLLDAAARVRSTASTKCNDVSSRSHFLFRLKITGVNEGSNLRTEGELNLVDLAGSERVKESQVSGKALEEAKFINKSLTSLGDVISGALTSRQTPCVCPQARRLARARRLTRHRPTCLTRHQPSLLTARAP